MESYKVLIVEDTQDLARIMLQFLRAKSDAEVLLATSGNQAIEIMATQKVNLIITDLYMSNGNGMKVIEKAEELGIDVVVHSGVMKAYELHLPEGIAILEKPSRLDDILEVINEFRGLATSRNIA